MTFLLLVVGALFGAVALGYPGFVLGAGLGYGIGLLRELRQRLDRLERTMEARKRRIAAETAAFQSASITPPPGVGRPETSLSPHDRAWERERYPEEPLIEVLRQADDVPDQAGAEIDDLLRQVGSGTLSRG